MNLETPWAAFGLVAMLFAVASSPLLRFVDDDAEQRFRNVPIDGLRGFLALGVFVFHLVVTHRYLATGVWAPPDSQFYAALGPVGVSVFFMLTGFLFWGRLLRAPGRPGWRALYIGRLFRIVPMYLAVVLAMLAIVAVRSGFVLQQSAAAVAVEVLQWLALGLIDTQPDVNGQPAGHLLAGVTWTLWYEWMFYAALPLLAPLARQRAHLVIVLAALLACLAAKALWQSSAAGFAALFAIGMAAASACHGRPAPRGRGRAGSVVALLALLAAFASAGADAGAGYGSGTALWLGLFFAAIARGASLGGLLGTTAAQRLGRVSYSLYLMQGLVLTLVFAVGPVAAFAARSAAAWWGVGAVAGLLLLAAAALGYRWIERPGIALGRRVLARLAARPRPAVDLTAV